MKIYWLNHIDGDWVDRVVAWIEVISLGSGENLAEHALAYAASVGRAVIAAQRVPHSGALSNLRPIKSGRMLQAMGLCWNTLTRLRQS